MISTSGYPACAASDHRLADTLIDRGDEFARDRAADDLVEEFVSLAAFLRLKLDHDVAILAGATGLANVPAFGAHRNGDGLLVGDLRPTDIRIDPELAQQAIDDHLEMQLAHPVDEGLARLLVGAHPEGRVFFGQAAERGAHLVLVGASLRLDRDRDDRLGKTIDSSTIGFAGSHRVSPVNEPFRPMMAAMSPAPTDWTSSRWFACMRSSRPIRSRSPLVEFSA